MEVSTISSNIEIKCPGGDAVPTDGSTIALGLGDMPVESQVGWGVGSTVATPTCRNPEKRLNKSQHT